MRDILDPGSRWIGRRLRSPAGQGNAAPVAVDDTLSVPRTSGPVSIPVLDNDIDPEGRPLVLVSAHAALGSAVAEADGTVTYTPPAGVPPGAVEYDTVVYEIADDLDQRASAQVDVTIGGADLQVNVTPENTLAVIADTAPIEITVTEPPAFAGSYGFDVADLAAGPVNLVAPGIAGTPGAGAVLSAEDGLWAHDTSALPVTQTWQWRRAGADIAGETGASYTMQAGDIGQGIAVAETLSDAGGARSSLSAAVSQGFLPSDDTQLIGWWDADDAATITESGGRLSAWADKAGSATLVQTNGVWQPAVGSRTLNGLPVLDFDGATRHLTAPLGLPASGDFALHMVLVIDSVASAFAAAVAVDAANDFQIDADNGTQFDGRLNVAGIGTTTPLAGGPFVGAMILSAVFDRTGAGAAEIFIGDLSRGAMTLTGAVDAAATLHVMTNRSRNASVTGAVAEIMLTGDVTNRADHHAYLSAKWGIS